MNKANKFFLSGVVFALAMIAFFANNSFFSIGFAENGRGKLPRELRLGVDIGILRNAELSSGNLNKAITRSSFAEKVGIIMDLTGNSVLSDAKALARAGIISNKSGNITRKEAVETFARVIIHLSNEGTVILPQEGAKNFRDYRIPQKYTGALAYLQKKFVVRGYPNGSLGASRRLTNKEAIYFLYRLYEAVSSDLMGKRTLDGISFIDMPLNHPLMNSIRNLTKAGAFDNVMLRPSFDGESYVSRNDLMEFISGIVSKAGHEIDNARVRNIFPGTSNETNANRRQLALMLELLLDTLAKDKLSAQKINYPDVTLDNPEFESLLKLAGCGITMGHGDGHFRAGASVTWNETIKLLDAVVRFAEIARPEPTPTTQLAQKSDVENFKAIIKAKRERIRKILNRE